MPGRWWEPLLACPDCERPLSLPSRCSCGFVPPESEPPDLRPQNPRVRSIVHRAGTTAPQDLANCTIERPEPAYDGPLPGRDSRELFSAALPWLRPGARLLDLGCGPRDQAAPAAHCGVSYVGIDYGSPAADLLGDAHAIPFAAGSFEVVLSYAVLEHLHDPRLALAEIHRVLAPGGIFVGTVSQGEPFHDSFFHHTAWGLLAVLRAAGFHPLRLWPSRDTIDALAEMGRYPRLIRLLLGAVHRLADAAPLLAPRKHFRWSARDRAIDELHRTAGICYLAEKPANVDAAAGLPPATQALA